MPARSSSPAGPRQALKRKRQPLRPGAASALQVVGVLFALLFFAVLLDEVAQCVDYAWEAVTVNFVLLAYTVTAYFVVEHARENGSDKTLERLLAVLDWVKEEGVFFAASFMEDTSSLALDARGANTKET